MHHRFDGSRDAELGVILGPVQRPVRQPSAIATAPLDEPEGYRDGGDHGDDEQDLGCYRTNLSSTKQACHGPSAPGQTIESGAGRVIGGVAVEIAVAVWHLLAGQR